MLIMGLARLVLGILNVLLVFQLPELPEEVTNVANSITGYISSGVGLVAAFVGSGTMNVLAVLLGLVLALNAAYAVYSLVFWVIRKIPMLNVKE